LTDDRDNRPILFFFLFEGSKGNVPQFMLWE